MPAINELRVAATEVMIAIAAHTEPNLVIRRKEDALYEVCRQWLDEHPVDDDEPVTEAWLEAIGFARGCLDVEYWVIECRSMALRLNSYPVKEIPTRGDVRRLCKALGIELRGGS